MKYKNKLVDLVTIYFFVYNTYFADKLVKYITLIVSLFLLVKFHQIQSLKTRYFSSYRVLKII